MIPGDLLVWLAGLSVGAGLVELGHWSADARRRRLERARRARLKQAMAEGQPLPSRHWRNPLDPRSRP